MFKQLLYRSQKYLVYADQLLFSGTAFVTTLALARLLGAASFGFYAGIVIWVYLWISFSSAFIINPYQVYPHKTDRHYQSFLLAFQLLGSIVFIGICSLCLLWIGFSAKLALGIGLFALGFSMNDFLRKFLLGIDALVPVFLLDLVVSILQCLALFFCWQQAMLSLENVLLYGALAYAPILFYLFYKMSFVQKGLVPWTVYLSRHIQEGKWLAMSAFVQWGASNVFVLASGAYLGVASLGALRLVQSLFGVLNIFLQISENHTLPKTSGIYAKSEEEGLDYLAKSNRRLLMVFSLALGLLFVFPTQALWLFGGEEYLGYDYLVRGLVLLYLLILINQPLRIALRMLVLNHHFLYGYTLSLTFTLLSAHFLISRYELIGVLSGLISSQLILIAYWAYVLHRKKFKVWKSFI